MLTQEILKEWLHYDPNTGAFTWIKAKKGIYIGQPAGTIWRGKRGRQVIHIQINGKIYKAHRLAWLYMKGEWPIKQIDHKDRNPLHNNWNNLRPADNSQNSMNKDPQSNNTSGVTGVWYDSKFDRWEAYITVNSIHHRLGRFKNKNQAIAARIKAEIEYFGEYRPLLNTPEITDILFAGKSISS